MPESAIERLRRLRGEAAPAAVEEFAPADAPKLEGFAQGPPQTAVDFKPEDLALMGDRSGRVSALFREQAERETDAALAGADAFTQAGSELLRIQNQTPQERMARLAEAPLDLDTGLEILRRAYRGQPATQGGLRLDRAWLTEEIREADRLARRGDREPPNFRRKVFEELDRLVPGIRTVGHARQILAQLPPVPEPEAPGAGEVATTVASGFVRGMNAPALGMAERVFGPGGFLENPEALEAARNVADPARTVLGLGRAEEVRAALEGSGLGRVALGGAELLGAVPGLRAAGGTLGRSGVVPGAGAGPGALGLYSGLSAGGDLEAAGGGVAFGGLAGTIGGPLRAFLTRLPAAQQAVAAQVLGRGAEGLTFAAADAILHGPDGERALQNFIFGLALGHKLDPKAVQRAVEAGTRARAGLKPGDPAPAREPMPGAEAGETIAQAVLERKASPEEVVSPEREAVATEAMVRAQAEGRPEKALERAVEALEAEPARDRPDGSRAAPYEPGAPLEAIPEGPQREAVRRAREEGVETVTSGVTEEGAGFAVGRTAEGEVRRVEVPATPEPEPVRFRDVADLEARIKESKSREGSDLVALFGAEGAKKYRTAERTANSPNASREAQDRALALMDQMEARLSPRERDRLFGIGEAGETAEQLIEVRRRALAFSESDTAAEIGTALAREVERAPTKGVEAEQVREIVRFGMQHAERLGLDPKAIERAFKESLLRRHRDPEDARLMWDKAVEMFGGRGVAAPALPAREAQRLPEPEVPSDAPRPVRVSEIGVDPARFQFKALVDKETGAGRQFEDVRRFDPIKADNLLLWEDASGRRWVADGHHRVELARRTGAETVNAFVVRESDGVTAEMARAMAAAKNIAAGKGTALDAAKMMRDAGWTEADLRREGISTTQGLGRSAVGLYKLDPSVFSQVINEVIPENFGAEIGRQLADKPGKQREAVKALQGARNIEEAASIIRQIRNAPEVVERQTGLFGEEVEARSNLLERARVEVAIRRMLSSDKALFSRLAEKAGRAEAVEGTRINVEGSRAEARTVEDIADTLERLADRGGAVSEIINDAARQVSSGIPAAKAAEAAVARLRNVDWRTDVEGAGSGEGAAGEVAQGSLFASGTVAPKEVERGVAWLRGDKPREMGPEAGAVRPGAVAGLLVAAPVTLPMRAGGAVLRAANATVTGIRDAGIKTVRAIPGVRVILGAAEKAARKILKDRVAPHLRGREFVSILAERGREISLARFDAEAAKRALSVDSSGRRLSTEAQEMLTRWMTGEPVTDAEVRAAVGDAVFERATKIHQQITKNQRVLRDLGWMSEQTLAEWEGRWLPRRYRTIEEARETPEFPVGRPGSAGVDPIRRRKDLPDEWRKAHGEIRDPAVLTALALTSQGVTIANLKLLSKIAASPRWSRPVRPEGVDGRQFHENPVPDSPRYGLLRGKYVHRAIREDVVGLLRERVPVWDSIAAVLDRALSEWKFGKVVGNPATHGRNIVGNQAFMLLHGLNPVDPLNLPHFRTALEIARAKPGHPAYELRRKAIQEGLLGTDFVSVETMDLVRQVEATPGGSWLERMGNYWKARGKDIVSGRVFSGIPGAQTVARVYQLEDSIPKLAAWSRLIRGDRLAGVRPHDAGEAAHIVRRDFPTYDQAINERIQQRRGLGGALVRQALPPFLTFTFEAGRIVGRAAWQKPVTAAAIMYGLLAAGEMGAQAIGLTDEEAAQAGLVPDWKRPGLLNIVVPWRSEDGHPQVWDISYTLPLGNEGRAVMRWLSGDEDPADDLGIESMPTGPFAALLFELGTNRNIFTQRPIDPSRGGGQSFAATSDSEGSRQTWRFVAEKLLPPLFPGAGYNWRKLQQAVDRAPIDPAGEITRSVGATIADTVFGVKIRELDLDREMMLRVRRLESLARMKLRRLKVIASDARIPEVDRRREYDELAGDIARIKVELERVHRAASRRGRR